MPVPTRAVDASFDELTLSEAECLKAQSWPVYWQCLWTGTEQPPARILSLRTAEQAGLRLAGYISLNSNPPGAWHIQQGRDGVPDDLWEKLDFVAIDVELPDIHVDEIRGAIIWLEALGKKVTLYTSYNAWMNYVIPGNSTEPADRGIPLINALWDDHPDFDFPTLRYGGWRDEQVFMEQWSGGTHVCGQFVDRNTIVHPRLIYSQEEEDDVTPQELLKQLLTLNVPLYPKDGQPSQPVTLNELLHYAYHGSPTEHKKLVTLDQAVPLAKVADTNRLALAVVRAALDKHLEVHNQSGGALDRYSGPFLVELARLLGQMEEATSEFAKNIQSETSG